MPYEKENLANALGRLNDTWASRNGDIDDRWAEAQWQDAMDNLAETLDAYIEARIVELLTPPADACTFCNSKPIVYKIREQLYCEKCRDIANDNTQPYLAVFKPMIYRKHGGG